ncbi:uracil phosphoribosyltransferase [Nostoc sp. LEGE 12447]|nr:uracil phosphoribosyltransferase [Nostoc sp. LEGE 12447]
MERFCRQYYNVIFYTYLIDDNLDEYSYIIPGLGNAGDAYTY